VPALASWTRAPLRSLSPVFGRHPSREPTVQARGVACTRGACERIRQNGLLALASSELTHGSGRGRRSWHPRSRGRVPMVGQGGARQVSGWFWVTLAGSSGRGSGCSRLPSRVMPPGSCEPWPSLASPVCRPTESAGVDGGTENDVRPNKGMKLTELSAAWLPGLACRRMPAPAGTDAGTAPQLIPSVRPTPEQGAERLRSRCRVDSRCVRTDQAERLAGLGILGVDPRFRSRAQVLASS
jgi:hypothetical protein